MSLDMATSQPSQSILRTSIRSSPRKYLSLGKDVIHHSPAPPLSFSRSSLSWRTVAPMLWKVTLGWILLGRDTVGSPAKPLHPHRFATSMSQEGSSLMPKLRKWQGGPGGGPHRVCPVEPIPASNTHSPCLTDWSSPRAKPGGLMIPAYLVR